MGVMREGGKGETVGVALVTSADVEGTDSHAWPSLRATPGDARSSRAVTNSDISVVLDKLAHWGCSWTIVPLSVACFGLIVLCSRTPSASAHAHSH